MSESVTPESEAARLYRFCKREYDCPHPSEDGVAEAIAAAEVRGRSSAAARIAELEHKLHAQRAMVEAAHVTFHEVAGTVYGHTPDEDDPAAMIRLVAKAAEERGRRRGVEEERKRAESVIHVMQQCIRGKCDCTYDGAATQFACEETARKMIDSWDADRARET